VFRTTATEILTLERQKGARGRQRADRRTIQHSLRAGAKPDCRRFKWRAVKRKPARRGLQTSTWSARFVRGTCRHPRPLTRKRLQRGAPPPPRIRAACATSKRPEDFAAALGACLTETQEPTGADARSTPHSRPSLLLWAVKNKKKQAKLRRSCRPFKNRLTAPFARTRSSIPNVCAVGLRPGTT